MSDVPLKELLIAERSRRRASSSSLLPFELVLVPANSSACEREVVKGAVTIKADRNEANERERDFC